MQIKFLKPSETLINARLGNQALWRADCVWSRKLVEHLPPDLAIAIYKQYIAKWEQYISKNGQSRSANIWIRRQVTMMDNALQQLPVPLSQLRNEVKRAALAKELANKCYDIMTKESGRAEITDVRDEMLVVAKHWGFSVAVPAQTIEADQAVDEAVAISQMARLISDDWWSRKLDITYRRFCEHCRIMSGKVRKGVSAYLSRAALREYRGRKAANLRALSNMIAKNEITGEEISLLEAVQASVSNPEIRRHELMVRMRGFEDIAEEDGLMGGFFTVTAPSKYHAFTKDKNGKARSNSKYIGTTPRDASRYLGKVWARARAKLNRLDIPLMGFRVCEPHHDATPHWHMLFFFKPEHEQVIRHVFADYFTREDRQELRVTDTDINKWAFAVAGNEGLPVCKAFLKNIYAQMGDKYDAEYLQRKTDEFTQSIPVTANRISPRFDYKAIDPEQGSATGYIAKYIAKNIDGFKVEEDFETGTASNDTAESVTGWASEWGIRQFQQIGGPAVSVWRELRRMEQDEATKAGIAAAKEVGEKYQRPVQSYIELKATKPTIEIARIAADSSSWSMFVTAMGGAFCPRNERPIQLQYKPQNNKYGEAVTKLKGLSTSIVTMLTRADGWVITKPSSAGALALSSDDNRAPWSSVNNCTEVQKEQVIDLLQRNGNAVDDLTISNLMRGCRYHVGDDQFIWLEKTDIGYQLKTANRKTVEQNRNPKVKVMDWDFDWSEIDDPADEYAGDVYGM
ncbi:replication endonuclease [Photobacterium leiognathi]|uniref:replication endonuclease n=1 Tax=Photobacterium leiognathi TaxID=553611 RepID=UPI002982B432|nr:replication endonuclease [Photobacterium leiognathi]